MPVPTSTKVVLVTGANRGVGLSIVEQYASQPNTVVYAGVRSTGPKDLSAGLQALLKKSPESVKALQIVSADEESNKAAAAFIEKEHGHIDIIIANAGVAYDWSPIDTVPVAAFKDQFSVNTLGPLVLYQSFVSLLGSKKGSKFVVISTSVASMATTGSFPFILAPYSTSKAAVNMVTRVIHAQSADSGLVAFPLHPGAVATDMTDGLKEALDPETWEAFKKSVMISPEESAKGIVEVVGGATRESHGGRFTSYDGSELEW